MKKIRWYLSAAALLFAAVSCICSYFLFAKPAEEKLQGVGSNIGKGVGNEVGTILGTVDGYTKGYQEGEEAGRKAGQSAEDTVVDPVKILQEFAYGKLEVLKVKQKVVDCQKYNSNKYVRLVSEEVTAIYSVDLSVAEIDYDEANSKITIRIPEPVVNISTDDELKIEAEYPSEGTDKKIKGLSDASDNAKKTLQSKIDNEIITNNDLKKRADNAALQQVKELARSISTVQNVEVAFLGGNNG